MGVHRIVFMRTDRIGDVLMNVPAIRLLRQTYPKAWICLFADASVQDLLKAHPDLDEFMAVDADRIKTSFPYRMHCVQNLRRAKFDLAVVSNPDKHLHWIAFLAGIRQRVGYRRKAHFLLTKTLRDEKAGSGRHEMDLNLKLVKLVSDKSWDGSCELPVEPKSAEAVSSRLSRALVSKKGVVAVHPGTSHPAKRWIEEGFAAVCRWADRQGFLPVLIGGSEETAASERVARRSDGAALDWTGSLSLAELAAFFHDRRVRALVSSDSGPVHVAWMSGTPVVALYAKDLPGSDPVRWGPRDGRSRTFHRPMNEIGPEEVCAALGKVLDPT